MEAPTPAQLVHNHRPDEGAGVDCPEYRTAEGVLRGACLDAIEQLAPAASATPPSPLVSIDEYALRQGVATRTVRRWLDADRIPGAVKLQGRWALPVNAVLQDAPAAAAGSSLATTPAPGQPGRTGQQLTVAAVLAPLPVMVPLDVAARVLGVTEYALRRNADYFQLVRMGDRGAYVMPKSRIRQLEG